VISWDFEKIALAGVSRSKAELGWGNGRNNESEETMSHRKLPNSDKYRLMGLGQSIRKQ